MASVGLRPGPSGRRRSFSAAFQKTGPACLVTDVRMPGINGLELRRQLKAEGVCIPTIMMTAFADVRLAVDAMKAGALEFLEKPFRPHDFCEAVQYAVRLGQRHWQQAEARRPIEKPGSGSSPTPRPGVGSHSGRQDQSGDCRGIQSSLRAIEDRRARIMKKLGVDADRPVEAGHPLCSARRTGRFCRRPAGHLTCGRRGAPNHQVPRRQHAGDCADRYDLDDPRRGFTQPSAKGYSGRWAILSPHFLPVFLSPSLFPPVQPAHAWLLLTLFGLSMVATSVSGAEPIDGHTAAAWLPQAGWTPQHRAAYFPPPRTRTGSWPCR